MNMHNSQTTSLFKLRAATLQETLARHNLDGYLIPSSDEWLNEYSPAHLKRLALFSGFTGSNGLALVWSAQISEKIGQIGILFTDSRYLIQAKGELDASWHICDFYNADAFSATLEASKANLAANLGNLANTIHLGFDPMVCSSRQYKQLYGQIAGHLGATLKPDSLELLSIIHKVDQTNEKSKITQFKSTTPIPHQEVDANAFEPVQGAENATPPPSLAYLLPLEATGKASAQKIKEILSKSHKECDMLLVCAPESIAWLLNMRAADIETTPVLLSYLLLSATNEKHKLFAQKFQVEPIKEYLNQLNIEIIDIDTHKPNLEPLKDYCQQQIKRGTRIQFDEQTTPYWFSLIYAQSEKNAKLAPIIAPDPILIAKSRKNTAEIAAIRAAHREDGRALTKFFTWLQGVLAGDIQTAGSPPLTEDSISTKLREFRAEQPNFITDSFPTIAGFASNSAIVHYRAQPGSDLKLEKRAGAILLLDSGGQYHYGTTDVTRTIAIGEPTPIQKQHYTAVLRGHIQLARAIFPAGTTGGQLDSHARYFLWQLGCDYGHGTGHGVGHFLGVHEGPQSISARSTSTALEAGMVVSIEPGVYFAGAYGIRIENLYLVAESDVKSGFLCFEPLTVLAINSELANLEQLNREESAWLSGYNAWVERELQKAGEEK